MTDKKPKFLRRVWQRYSKLGKGRRKIQKWRKPTGRDNKMREKRKGVPVVVSIGYKQGEKVRGLLKEKKKVLVRNVKDLDKVGKNEIAVIGKVGMKKKMEIAKKAKEKKVEIYNLNAKSFLKNAEIKIKKRNDNKKKIVEEKSKTEKKKIKKVKTEKKEKSESKKEIVEDIEKSGVSEEVAKAEEKLDEKAQEEGK